MLFYFYIVYFFLNFLSKLFFILSFFQWVSSKQYLFQCQSTFLQYKYFNAHVSFCHCYDSIFSFLLNQVNFQFQLNVKPSQPCSDWWKETCIYKTLLFHPWKNRHLGTKHVNTKPFFFFLHWNRQHHDCQSDIHQSIISQLESPYQRMLVMWPQS